MSDRPRVLTLWLSTWYGSGKAVSAEEMLWGRGLLGRLGYDQHHIHLEAVGHAELERIIRAYAPYEFVVYGPYQEVPFWLRPMLDPGTPIISLHSDADARYQQFDRHFMNVSDVIWHTSEMAAQKFHEARFDGALLSNWATRPEWGMRDPIQIPQRGASFCGLLYGDRLETLKAIGDAGNITVMVHNWKDQILSPEEYHRFTASWAFALCLTRSSSGMLQMKGRMFEPQIHGAVLVTEPMPGLERWWIPDEEMLVFTSPQEAQDKMHFLLDDPSRYLQMSEKAYNRLLREHTWYHRFREILAKIGKTPPDWPYELFHEPRPTPLVPLEPSPILLTDL